MLEAFSETHELSHRFSLELLNVFVLLLELTVCGVFKGT